MPTSRHVGAGFESVSRMRRSARDPDRRAWRRTERAFVLGPESRSKRLLALIASVPAGPRLLHILVAAAGQVDDQHGLLARLSDELQRVRERVGGFEVADDAFRTSEEGAKAASASRSVRRHNRAAAVLQEGVLRPHRRIIQPGRDRPALANLPVIVLQHVGFGAVEDTGLAAKQGRAMLGASNPPPPPRSRSSARLRPRRSRRTVPWRWSRRRRRR